jgi:DNA-binding MarR family transcriptional regulator
MTVWSNRAGEVGVAVVPRQRWLLYRLSVMKVPSKVVRAPARTLPRVSYLVKELERALRGRIDEILQPFALTAVQYTALSVLSLHAGMSSAQLARRSFVSPQAANEMVGALERRGLIRRKGDTEGGRALSIFLTALGRRTLARCDAQVDALEARFLGGFSDREETQLRVMLRAGRDAVRVDAAPAQRTTRRVARAR